MLVTSRKDCCIKRFTLDGQYLDRINLPGGYPCRPVIHGDHLFVSLCWSGSHLRPNSGFLVVLDKNNQVCETLGGTAELDSDGNLIRQKYLAIDEIKINGIRMRKDYIYLRGNVKGSDGSKFKANNLYDNGNSYN